MTSPTTTTQADWNDDDRAPLRPLRQETLTEEDRLMALPPLWQILRDMYRGQDGDAEPEEDILPIAYGILPEDILPVGGDWGWGRTNAAPAQQSPGVTM